MRNSRLISLQSASTMPNYHLFDCGNFFNQFRNHDGPLPDWESARMHITGFFFDLRSNLLMRVNEHVELTIWVRPVAPKQMDGEDNSDFQKRKHFFFFTYFRALCYEIQEKIQSALISGELQNEAIGMLLDEVERLESLLTLIGYIIDPSTQPQREEEITVEHNTERTLQAEENSAESVAELDSEEESESRGGEDIEAYMEEIRSVTISDFTERNSTASGQIALASASSIAANIDSPTWEVDLAWTPFGRFTSSETSRDNVIKKQSYFNFVQPFDGSDEILKEFSLSSTIIDPTDFLNLDAYKRRPEDILKEMRQSIAGVADISSVLYQRETKEAIL